MRFLVDECTGPTVARWLRGSGHDVFSVFDDARGASDEIGVVVNRISVPEPTRSGAKLALDRMLEIT